MPAAKKTPAKKISLTMLRREHDKLARQVAKLKNQIDERLPPPPPPYEIQVLQGLVQINRHDIWRATTARGFESPEEVTAEAMNTPAFHKAIDGIAHELMATMLVKDIREHLLQLPNIQKALDQSKITGVMFNDVPYTPNGSMLGLSVEIYRKHDGKEGQRALVIKEMMSTLNISAPHANTYYQNIRMKMQGAMRRREADKMIEQAAMLFPPLTCA